MSKMPMQPTQVRAEKTRQKLIDASIECLAKHGYAGAQLGLISEYAGVSRRPRQYYFPTRISLMSEVWHEIRRRDDDAFNRLHGDAQPLAVTVDRILESAFNKYRTAQYLADLELKLAMRSDAALAAELAPLIEQREHEADEAWVQLFAALGKSRTELVAIRYLHISLLRGLAVEFLSREDHSQLPTLEEQFKRIMHAALA